MGVRDKLRTTGIPPKPQPTALVDRNALRRGDMARVKFPIEFNDYGVFTKRIDIEFDVVICASSVNRYDKIRRILEQIFSQKTNYRFKFILLNDGSTDENYEKLEKDFPEIIYLKNDIGGGKIHYWRTVNTLWGEGRKMKTFTILQLDDDFVLCDNFLNILMDGFFNMKAVSNNYMAFTFHLYTFNKNDQIPEEYWFDEDEVFVDGGMLLDTQFLEQFDYELDEIEKRVTPNSITYTWTRVKERLIEYGMRVYRFRNSLVWHDGNEDSQLHRKLRVVKKIYTKNFIDGNILDKL